MTMIHKASHINNSCREKVIKHSKAISKRRKIVFNLVEDKMSNRKLHQDNLLHHQFLILILRIWIRRNLFRDSSLLMILKKRKKM